MIDILESACNEYDGEAKIEIMQAEMIRFYKETFETEQQIFNRQYSWRTSRTFRLRCDQFREAMYSRENTVGSKVEKYLYSYKDYSDFVENKKKRSEKMNKKLYRYRGYLQAKVGQDYSVLENEYRSVIGFPELVASPDARVQIRGSEYVLIFCDLSEGLENREYETLEQGLACAADHLPVYGDENELQLKWDSKYLYEAAGLLQAFPEAVDCKLVLFGILDTDIKEVIIPRIPIDNIRYEKYPAMRRSIKSLSDMFIKLRVFYFGALLPELAFPRKIHGLPLRSKLVDTAVISHTVETCTGIILDQDQLFCGNKV